MIKEGKQEEDDMETLPALVETPLDSLFYNRLTSKTTQPKSISLPSHDFNQIYHKQLSQMSLEQLESELKKKKRILESLSKLPDNGEKTKKTIQMIEQLIEERKKIAPLPNLIKDPRPTFRSGNFVDYSTQEQKEILDWAQKFNGPLSSETMQQLSEANTRFKQKQQNQFDSPKKLIFNETLIKGRLGLEMRNNPEARKKFPDLLITQRSMQFLPDEELGELTFVSEHQSIQSFDEMEILEENFLSQKIKEMNLNQNEDEEDEEINQQNDEQNYEQNNLSDID